MYYVYELIYSHVVYKQGETGECKVYTCGCDDDDGDDYWMWWLKVMMMMWWATGYASSV